MLLSGPKVRRLKWGKVPELREPPPGAVWVNIEHEPWRMLAVAALVDVKIPAVATTRLQRGDPPPMMNLTYPDQPPDGRDVSVTVPWSRWVREDNMRAIERDLNLAGVDAPAHRDAMIHKWWITLPPGTDEDTFWGIFDRSMAAIGDDPRSDRLAYEWLRESLLARYTARE